MDTGNIIALVSLVVTTIGLGGVAVWRLVGMIGEVDKRRAENTRDLHQKIEQTAESLDSKFNVVRGMLDNVKQDYVRRDDLDGHIARFEKQLEQVASALDRVRARFDEGFLEVIKLLSSRGVTKPDG